MGEILDFFIDFERKLLALLRDMFVRPHDVIASIHAKDKKYLGAFKFYSTVFSLWFIVLRLSNSWLQFFDEDWVLPQRLYEYSQSQIEFGFFIAPFLGLAAFFLPIGLLNFLFFRRSGYSLITHLSFATIVGGMIMIYYLPTAFIITALTESNMPQEIVAVSGVLVLAMPAFYTTYLYVRVFEGRKWIHATKGILIVGVCAFVFIAYVLSTDFQDDIHKNIFFRKYARFDLPVNVPANAYEQTAPDYDERLFYFQTVNSRRSHAFAAARPTGDYTFEIRSVSEKDTIDGLLPGVKFDGAFSWFVVNDLRDRIFVSRAPMRYMETPASAWLYNRKGELLSMRDSISNLHAFSFAADTPLGIVVAGSGKDTRTPLIGELKDPTLEIKWHQLPGLKDFLVDKIMARDSSGFMEMVVQRTVDKKLREIRWLHGFVSADTFAITRQLELYRNDFAPTKNQRFTFIHNAELLDVGDGKSIVTYQIMTDSSFALDVTSIDVHSGEQKWNKTYSVPADMAAFQHTLYFDGRLFVFGTATSIFQKGIMGAVSRHPFLMIIDAEKGTLENIYYFPPEDDVEGNLEYFLNYVPMVFRSDRKIYWTPDGSKTYIITTDSL